MVFLNGMFVGSYEDIMCWYAKGELTGVLCKCAGIDDDEEML